jgi:hypothetical protein
LTGALVGNTEVDLRRYHSTPQDCPPSSYPRRCQTRAGHNT